MKLVVIQNAPVTSDDLKNIQKMLKASDVLVGACVDKLALYNFADYLIFKEEYSGEVRVLLDRNFLTRIVDLARGKTVNSADPLYSLVSAAMSFFIYCDVIIDPAVALYEYGHHQGHSEATDDLSYFRIADHVHPQAFADIALGRSDIIEKYELDTAKGFCENTLESKEDNYAKQISDWRLNYLFALKIAQLKKLSLLPEQKIEKFLIWMHEETLFSFHPET
jgi:hypothetical protein